MTDRAPTPEQEIAGTINELAGETRRLVRTEAKEAENEVWAKARANAPVIALFSAAGLLALLSGASLYRFTMRLLERMLPPSLAALFGAALYGAGAVALVRLGTARLDDVRAPLPTETARKTVEDVRQAATGSR